MSSFFYDCLLKKNGYNIVMKQMWEILVPTTSNEGKPYHTRYHRVWDEKVRNITGGLTINKPVKGQWVGPEDELFEERMIPVRIVATREEMNQIVEMTMEYYDQLAVLAYRIGEEVIYKVRNND